MRERTVEYPWSVIIAGLAIIGLARVCIDVIELVSDVIKSRHRD